MTMARFKGNRNHERLGCTRLTFRERGEHSTEEESLETVTRLGGRFKLPPLIPTESNVHFTGPKLGNEKTHSPAGGRGWWRIGPNGGPRTSRSDASDKKWFNPQEHRLSTQGSKNPKRRHAGTNVPSGPPFVTEELRRKNSKSRVSFGAKPGRANDLREGRDTNVNTAQRQMAL